MSLRGVVTWDSRRTCSRGMWGHQEVPRDMGQQEGRFPEDGRARGLRDSAAPPVAAAREGTRDRDSAARARRGWCRTGPDRTGPDRTGPPPRLDPHPPAGGYSRGPARLMPVPAGSVRFPPVRPGPRHVPLPPAQQEPKVLRPTGTRPRAPPDAFFSDWLRRRRSAWIRLFP